MVAPGDSKPLTDEERRTLTQVFNIVFRDHGQFGHASADGRIEMSGTDNSVTGGGDVAKGDVIKQTAGRDMKGAAAGRGASSCYSETSTKTIDSVTGLKAAINDLAEQVSAADIPVEEKARLLPALLWWAGSVEQSDPPADAGEHLAKVQTAAAWIRERFKGIFERVSGTLVAHWAIAFCKDLES